MKKNNDKNTFFSNDLLNKFFELLALEPDISKWSKNNFKDNEPRLYRYLQIKALLRALELPLNIKKFVNGSFLKDENSLEFRILMGYKMQLIKPLSYTDGIYTLPPRLQNTYELIFKFNNQILSKNRDIDKKLLDLISNKETCFTLDDLVTKYNYPDIDMEEIDIKNF
jgi:hypothetical protein